MQDHAINQGHQRGRSSTSRLKLVGAAMALLMTVVAASSIELAAAGGPYVESKFVDVGGPSGQSFGTTVAAGADTIAVLAAASSVDTGELIDEVATVLRPNELGVVTPTKLTPNGYPLGTHFGDSLAVRDDGAILVGNTTSYAPDNDAGSAYLFTPDEAGGYSETKFKASDATSRSGYGSSAAISDDLLVIGAPAEDELASNAGAVYVYQRDGVGGFTETKLTAYDGRPNDFFGSAVAVAGETIVVGAPSSPNDRKLGRVYGFQPDGAGGFTSTRLRASDGAPADSLGASVAITGDTVVVGAPRAENARGAVYAFELDGAGKYRETKLTAPDPTDFDRFGDAVDADAGRILVGSPGFSGAVHLYEPDGAGGFKGSTIVASDQASSDRFGQAVAFRGESIVVGAPGDDDERNSSGAVYVFEPTSVQATCNGLTAAQAEAEGYSVTDLRAATSRQKFYGTAEPDFVLGSDFRDFLQGNDGADVICGRGGNDIIFGNKGADFVDGGDGDDRIDGNRGPDTVLGGNGDDELYGSGSPDTILGGPGADRVFGGGGNDIIDGGEGNDRLAGNDGNDTIEGGPGADRILGHSGIDTCDTSDPTDVITDCEDAPLTETKLRASDARQYRNFGTALAADGDNIVVGSNRSGDFNGNPPSVALLYQPDGAGGFNETLLDPRNDGVSSFFPAVAINDSTVVLGGSDEETVLVYSPDGAGGFVTTQLVSPAPDRSRFGLSVAITQSGSIVVGAPRDHTDEGAVYLFEPDGIGGYDSTKLVSPSPLLSGQFGYRVAAAGATIVISEPGSRSVFVFEPDAAASYTGSELQLTGGPVSDPVWHAEVATDGDVVLIGAPRVNGNTGAAYLFERDATGSFTTHTSVVADDGNPGDFFGISVAVDNGRALVGASLHGVGGAAYLLEPSGSGFEQTKIQSSDISARDFFGASVAMSGNRLILGARDDESGGDLSPSGSIYIYE